MNDFDLQALLKLFGVHVVRAPGEAEAQCAAIEGQGLTSGTITDDSDVWLFGGKNVYRHFFDKRHFVKKYDSLSIERFLGSFRRFSVSELNLSHFSKNLTVLQV